MTGKINPRILLVFIAFLLITNIGMLIYFSRMHKKAPQKDPSSRMGELLRREVGFDDQQIARYLDLRSMRDSILKVPNQELRQSRLHLIELLSQTNGPVNDSLLSKASEDIGQKQARIEREYFHHFQRVKSLGTAEQAARFDSLLLRMANRSGTDEGRKPNNSNPKK